MKIRIDLKIFLITFIFILTNQIKIYMLVMLFALIHELGHLLAGLLLKLKPEKIEIIPVGVSIAFGLKTEDFNHKIGKANLLEIKKILIAIAGPLTNTIIMWIALKLQINIIQKITIIYVNILIIMFNLLPIYPLDGGRILRGILNICVGKRKSNKYMNGISMIVTACVTALALVAMWYSRNMAWVFITIYLWIIVIKECKINKQQQKIYEILLRRKHLMQMLMKHL